MTFQAAENSGRDYGNEQPARVGLNVRIEYDGLRNKTILILPPDVRTVDDWEIEINFE
jgi:hypothetical protein